MKAYIFKEELFSEIIGEVKPLYQEHYIEIAHFHDIELAPDIEVYLLMEQNDRLRIYTSRTSEGELVGYCAFFVGPSLHYKESHQASQDVIFISKSHRGFGRSFVDYCEQMLKEEGVEVVYHHVKKAHNWSHILEEKGYECIDMIYGKKL